MPLTRGAGCRAMLKPVSQHSAGLFHALVWFLRFACRSLFSGFDAIISEFDAHTCGYGGNE